MADHGEHVSPVNRLSNEILIAIFAQLSTSSDVPHAMLACKRWSLNGVNILWHQPSSTTWDKYKLICRTLSADNPYFYYRHFIKCLNLASIQKSVNDSIIIPFASCNWIKHLTLPNCKNLTDSGLIPLITNSRHLLDLDISKNNRITEQSIFAIAEQCKQLQKLNITGCDKISHESIINLAKNCRYLKMVSFLPECWNV